MRIKLIFFLTISLALVLVIVQNTSPVQTRFLWFAAELPAIVLLLLTSVSAFISGLLVGFLLRGNAK